MLLACGNGCEGWILVPLHDVSLDPQAVAEL